MANRRTTNSVELNCKNGHHDFEQSQIKRLKLGLRRVVIQAHIRSTFSSLLRYAICLLYTARERITMMETVQVVEREGLRRSKFNEFVRLVKTCVEHECSGTCHGTRYH